MNRTADDDLELRLTQAFARDGLPSAPYGLGSILERVPDQPVNARPRTARRTGWTVLGIAAVLGIGGVYALVGGNRDPSLPRSSDPPLQPGSTRLTYAIEWSGDAAPYTEALLRSEVRVAQDRLDHLAGAEAARVNSSGTDRLVIDVPTPRLAAIRQVLASQPGNVEFVPMGKEQPADGSLIDRARFPALFDESDVVSAAVRSSDQTEQPVISIQLSPAGSTLFGAYTSRHIGEYFAIAVDGRIVMAPAIHSSIPGGSIELTGPGTDPRETLDPLVAILRSGPLPAPLREVSVGPPATSSVQATSSAPASILPSDGAMVPSVEPAPLPSDVVIHCEPPIDVEGPQIDCRGAIDDALDVLPANHPAIDTIRFSHSCVETGNYAADCAVQLSGLVSIQFVDRRSISMEVVFGTRPRLVVNKRNVPDAPPFPLPEARAGEACSDSPGVRETVTIGIDPHLANPVWAYAPDLTPVELRFGPGLRSIGGPIPLIITSDASVFAYSGATILTGREAMLPGIDVCRTPDGGFLVVERDA
jgi:hypothetical protein